eukprot:CAMPEP_0183432254 /NCGR_PEP_ID=MMETSP0370-20130417/56631_1 /TAXON_ID=268820 /ORGANISM="Peridinium aciculiferum, Strain PAER-2" /LENGTH=46 /DNA_ID= /DNA_START= /DNA_END= /DNA_ORIENTATION=
MSMAAGLLISDARVPMPGSSSEQLFTPAVSLVHGANSAMSGTSSER